MVGVFEVLSSILMGIMKVHCNGHHKGLGSGKRKTTWRICSSGHSLALLSPQTRINVFERHGVGRHEDLLIHLPTCLK